MLVKFNLLVAELLVQNFSKTIVIAKEIAMIKLYTFVFARKARITDKSR
ncbi:MAG: hypothetical protein CLLPBCKN_005558 [Chroococcidiopsis cubana SAG 39.79]|nr:hypothetical protein [Chroococcidiopsis cubana SAG 39.79]